MTTIVVHGGGRMAREVVHAIETGRAELGAVVSRNRPGWLQSENWYASMDELPDLPDLVIDFTLPGGTMQVADWCRARLVALVSGTTGLTAGDEAALEEAAELVPVLWAPNLSKGLNMLMIDVAEAAASLGREAAVEIMDVHHVHKKDAPSGTALALARAVAAAWAVDLDSCLVSAGLDAADTAPGRIVCRSRREGEVIGEHQVRFTTPDERVEFRHAAENRNIYAVGSVQAGQWLLRQPAGLYGATDWLSG